MPSHSWSLIWASPCRKALDGDWDHRKEPPEVGTPTPIPHQSADWLLVAQVSREGATGSLWSHWSQHSQPAEGPGRGIKGTTQGVDRETKKSLTWAGQRPDCCPCLAIQSSFYSHSGSQPQPLTALVPPCFPLHLFLGPFLPPLSLVPAFDLPSLF